MKNCKVGDIVTLKTGPTIYVDRLAVVINKETTLSTIMMIDTDESIVVKNEWLTDSIWS